MNFELTDKLYSLLESQKLDEAIALAEKELREITQSNFHKILGRNLLHMTSDLTNYITAFDKSTVEVLIKRQGFLKRIFERGKTSKPAAYYCEMNGFTVNYDRWFIDLYSFEYYSLTDWDWLSDFYDSPSNDLTLTGLEDIQKVFQDVHENDRFEEPNIKKAYEVCELLVILRLQELFKVSYLENEGEWSNIPMFITAHDYDLIYCANHNKG
ncbi:MAG: hypothetical protein V7724_07330 [Sediminicola sp.]